MSEILWLTFNNKRLLALEIVDEKKKPENDIHMKLGQKKFRKLRRFTLTIAGKWTALKGIRKKYCIGSRLLSSA